MRGDAAQAVAACLDAAKLTDGPLFRRLFRHSTVGPRGLSTDQVARIVQRRASLAGLPGDWAAHSMRSGFVTQAGRQGGALGEVTAMTEQRSVGMVLGYFQAGTLLSSRASALQLPGSGPESAAGSDPVP